MVRPMSLSSPSWQSRSYKDDELEVGGWMDGGWVGRRRMTPSPSSSIPGLGSSVRTRLMKCTNERCYEGRRNISSMTIREMTRRFFYFESLSLRTIPVCPSIIVSIPSLGTTYWDFQTRICNVIYAVIRTHQKGRVCRKLGNREWTQIHLFPTNTSLPYECQVPRRRRAI